MYFIYVIRCEDESLYTGITTDIKRRLKEHMTKSDKCAKYTRLHTALRLEVVWKTESGRSAASRLEYAIKQLSKEKKEMLIKKPGELEAVCGSDFGSEIYTTENVT